MIETILEILKFVLATLPFFLLCLLNVKVNLPKAQRSRQFAMPIITTVYVLLAMWGMSDFNGWIFNLINSIPGWIASLATQSWMPMELSDLLFRLSEWVAEFLSKLNLPLWIFFIANVLLFLLYMLIKWVCLGIIKKAVKADGAVHTKIAAWFYRFFFERNAWFLKDSYVQVRGMLKVFYYSTAIIFSVLMVISAKLYTEGLLSQVFYPVFGLLVIGDLFFYLDGMTQEEYGVVMGENDEAYHMANYSLLRKFLRNLFKDKLLAENTGLNSALSYGSTTEDILCELDKSEDQMITSFAAYIKALNKTGFPIDHNYLYSSLELLKGTSILFNNPFYKDLIPYAFYPMNRTLLSHKKVLVVLGRHAIEEDIREWLEQGVGAVTNIPFMWDIQVLSEEPSVNEPDIGIITRSDVLNTRLHNANAAFLEKVGFVVIIEPSKLLATAQIGLNLIIKQCNPDDDKNIVYCMCDKNCDGLVDAMSHVLLTSITEVSATNKHKGTCSYMCWEADKEYLHHRLVPNISRYLGFGTELSFAALKNQIAKAEWYGGEAFPVADMRWIDRQYYYDLTKYAGLPAAQESMDTFFHTSYNFWSAAVEKNNYFTVEDEAFNMFEILRDFSTRTSVQGFINVISSEYLLKDYMADNAAIFEADPKAIPYIVADYTRSNRNTILRLILLMSTRPVGASTLQKELSLIGITTFDLTLQLWYEMYLCYAPLSEISALQGETYRERVEEAASKTLTLGDVTVDRSILETAEKFNLKRGCAETVYTITDAAFLRKFVSELRSGGYVSEDEKGQKHYIGAELCGHIHQKFLPGQFFTFGGKYYEMQYLTADGQILVRRAADHIHGRPTYRQIREYTLLGTKSSDRIGAKRDVAGLKISREFADIRVETPGYYRMNRYNDFVTAKKIIFEENGIPQRMYRNKEILRIELPGVDDKVRYTITMLFNEIFRTLFAENQAFICAVTANAAMEDDGIHPITYSLTADGCTLQDTSIYIIEDSQLDLGLTVAVERNLQRILEIMHDYLEWHTTTLETSLTPPAPPASPVEFRATPIPQNGDVTPAEQPKKKGFFGRMIDKIKNLFRKKDKIPETEIPSAETPVEQQMPPAEEQTPPAAEPVAEETPAAEAPVEEAPAEEAPAEDTPAEQSPVTGEETPSEQPKKKKSWFGWLKRKKKVADVPAQPEAPAAPELPAEAETAEPVTDIEQPAEPEEKNAPMPLEYTAAPTAPAEAEAGIIPPRKPYHERYFLLFGDVNEPACIDTMGAKQYLEDLGLAFNALRQAREGKNIAKAIEASYVPDKPDARYCDFCGTEIFGVEYETLADGRDRCIHCSSTAIKSEKEFKRIFEDVRRNMESFFGIRLNVGVRVEMVNSKTLHRRLGHNFTPTPKADGRVLGVAIKDKTGFTLMVENGSPRMASTLTIAHELTHIWQYVNWDAKAIRRLYGKDMELEVYEGMAKWIEVQYAYLINEQALAKRTEIMTAYRDDEYGRGFLRYRANYPFSLGTVLNGRTPFMDTVQPLAPEYCGNITVVAPRDEGVGLPGEDDTPHDTQTAPVAPETPSVPTEEEATRGPIRRDPDNVPKFAYEQLPPEQKEVYDLFLAAIRNFETDVINLPTALTVEDGRRIIDYVLTDHPEIFWFYYNDKYLYDVQTGIVDKVMFEYRMTRDEALRRQNEIVDAIQPFLNSLNDGMSDYEVVERVYENIVRLVDYDTVGLERQRKLPRSERKGMPDDLRSIYGVFVDRKAVCVGYAKAFQFLLTLLGIECTYVTSETHAWNLLKLEGDYYHLDVTWGDGSDTLAENNTDTAVDYSCFCITTQEVLRLDSHTPENILTLPDCTAVQCNYHRRHGLYLETFDYNKVLSIVCECVKRGETTISLKFGSDAAFTQAERQLIEEGRFIEVLRYANLKTGARLDLRYAYMASAEKRVINFKVGEL